MIMVYTNILLFIYVKFFNNMNRFYDKSQNILKLILILCITSDHAYRIS